MRLKSLELQGFKSFPDRTKLNFDSGMTVVIGPNGSGKSNIADAIRWVLGELSSKNIRGTKMEDVIFAGTDNRRPMGYAEVSLTFDNTDKDNQLPIDYDEVTVTRKYYRSGDSEYLINGQKVRLRDITELFMNTGLGKSGYSIIGQGRIAEIISKKSEDRRGIFEEAAGISKYRYRKSEAERDLAKTDDNLSRVTDILSELEGRVGPLEKDAEKARRYLELYAQKKEIDVGLWLYEIDSIRVRSEKLSEDYEISKHELEMAEDSLSGLDRQAELLLARMKENNERSEDARRKAAELSEKKHRASADVLLLEKDIEHLESESERLNKEAQTAKEEGENELARRGELASETSAIKDRIASFTLALDDVQKKIEQARADVERLTAGKEDADGAVEEAKAALQQLMIDLSNLEGSKKSENERKAELEERISELSASIRKCGEKILEKEKTLSGYKSKVEEIKENLASYDEKIRCLAEKETAAREKSDALTVQENTVRERIRLLRHMEEHFEGYAGSVRRVMEESLAGRLTGIRGPVSKLISVDERCSVAVETALGGALQHIVTEDDEAAKRAIEELKRSGSGRATFYPISVMKPKKPDIDYKKLGAQHGFVGMANDLVSCDGHDRPVIDWLLCQTAVCETLEDASAIGKAFSYRFRIVSLDGQVVNAGGSLTGGSVKKDGGILSRSREISRLETEEKAVSAERSKVLSDLEQLKKERTDAENQKENENQTLEIVNVMFSSEDTEYKVLLSRFESERSQLDALTEGTKALDEQMQSYEQRKNELEEQIKEAEKKVGEQKDGAEAFVRMLEEAGIARGEAIEEKNGMLFEKSALEKDLSSDEREIERIDLRIAELQRLYASHLESAGRAKEKKAACQKEKSEKEALTKELSLELGTLAEQDEEFKKENEEYEKQSSSIREQQKDKSRHREILFREYTRLEGAMEAIKSEQERYTSRLWDEYELTYAASKELGCPEVTAETRNETVTKQTRLRNKIRELGAVNVGAIDEYAEVKERYDFLSKQYTDLTNARAELTSVITGLEKDMKSRFAEVFSAINDNFRVVFAELFGGGTAELSLSDPENILESGIEIAVAPPGKIIKSLSLLSGGEQVFVAIALFFAILRVNPAPFCLLDEIEAALDEVNVARFASYARNYSSKSQFIIITHRRGTMEEADTMYGVTMGERGISKVLPLHLNDVESKAFKIE